MYRQTNKQTNKEIDTQATFARGKADRQTNTQESRQTEILHMYRFLYGQTNRQNYRLLDGWTDSQTIGWMDRQINREI